MLYFEGKLNCGPYLTEFLRVPSHQGSPSVLTFPPRGAIVHVNPVVTQLLHTVVKATYFFYAYTLYPSILILPCPKNLICLNRRCTFVYLFHSFSIHTLLRKDEARKDEQVAIWLSLDKPHKYLDDNWILKSEVAKAIFARETKVRERVCA